jgi:hypothetical protein
MSVMVSRCSHSTFVTKRCRKAWSLRSRKPVRSRREGPGKSVHSPWVVGHQGTGVGQQRGIPMSRQTGSMDEARAAEVMAESAAVLRNAGARFAYLHGKPVVDEDRVLRLLRSIADDTAVLRQEAGATQERRQDPIWLRGVKYTFVTAIEACVDVA